MNFTKKNNFKFQIVKVTENEIKQNNLDCLENILETYLLNDGTIYFNFNNGIIAELIPNSCKDIKNNVSYEEVKENICKRVIWNGWSIHEYIE